MQIRILAVAVALAALSTSAIAQDKPLEMERSTKAGTVGGGQAESVTATVVALDLDKRLITLKNEKGQTDTFQVGKDVKNLAQVKVGDRVIVDFWRGMVLEFQPPGTPAKAATATVAGGSAAPGAKPGGEAMVELQGTVTVKSINEKTRVVTLQGEGGRVFDLKAGPSVDLSKAKVGMQFLATYNAGVAVEVKPAPAKKGKAKKQ